MEKENVYDKPFKTISEQIDILKSRNVMIDDVPFAESVLNGLSYYTIINGYKNSFLSITGTNSFTKGTKIEDLYTLHVLDTSVSSIIFKNILYVERYLKTKISYLVANKYGVFTDYTDVSNLNPKDYLYIKNYSRSPGRRENILRKIKASILSDRKNIIMEHYLDTKNHIPPWITVTNIPFGLAIEWYVILVDEDKGTICQQFIPSDKIDLTAKKEFLKKALYLLKEYRNNIAHGNRTFNTTTRSVLPKKQVLKLSDGMLSKSEYDSRIGQNDLFAVIISILILIDDRYILKNFYNDLAYALLPYEKILFAGETIFKTFNLPDNIFPRTEKYLENK